MAGSKQILLNLVELVVGKPRGHRYKIGTGYVPITLNYGASASMCGTTVGTVIKSKTGSRGLNTLNTVGTVGMFWQ